MHIWRDDDFGFGGNGTRRNEFCVETGAFRASRWSQPAAENIVEVLQQSNYMLGFCDVKNYEGSHKLCLRRSFNNLPANVAHVLKTIEISCSKFNDFDRIVRADYHTDIHNEVGNYLIEFFTVFFNSFSFLK